MLKIANLAFKTAEKVFSNKGLPYVTYSDKYDKPLTSPDNLLMHIALLYHYEILAQYLVFSCLSPYLVQLKSNWYQYVQKKHTQQSFLLHKSLTMAK